MSFSYITLVTIVTFWTKRLQSWESYISYQRPAPFPENPKGLRDGGLRDRVLTVDKVNSQDPVLRMLRS
jgi:hypothetical protein